MDSIANNLLPDPHRTLEDWERLNHHDLERLTAVDLWAEQTVLTAHLAGLIFGRARPQGLYTAADGSVVTVEAWLRSRIAKLKDETARRRGARAA